MKPTQWISMACDQRNDTLSVTSITLQKQEQKSWANECEKKKNSGNSKESKRNLSNIIHSNRCIVIIHSLIPYGGLFFESQRNTIFFQGNPTTLFIFHLQCNKQIVKMQNNISVKSKQYSNFLPGRSS